ncbi:translocation/assembly module TamB domain-containing protein [Flavobacterium soli]|uniref:translocation/assembly module TamB domain-containing protein n=1 Tax=Flavobacterium soli TaxID=344881 RepID=UPI0004276C40|nr:translocation/assembly module TamB domain-containing protein [Flavobacterium soli]
MEKATKVSRFRRIKKIVFRVLLGLILFLLLSGILLSLPVVQTKIGDYVTNMLNEDFGTDIDIEQVTVSIFGGVKLKSVMIKDHHQDTLIYANRIKTNILDISKAIDGDLLFGDIRLDGLVFNLKNYKDEDDTNLDRFIALFDDGKPSTSKKRFLLQAKNAYFTNSRFMVIDENLEIPVSVDFTKLNTSLNNFKIYGPDVTAKINKMSFKDHRGLFVENLSSKFSYSKTSIVLEELDLTTKNSFFKGNVVLKYDRKDFADFNNRVVFDVNIDESSLATNDIRYFYAELGKNQKFDLKAKLNGTLNDITFKNLKLIDEKNSQIIGNVNFKNLLGKGDQEFYMKGDFYKVSSNYEDLVTLLPNVLGKKLPTSLRNIGQFTLVGSAEITKKTITTDFFMSTKIGNIKSDLAMTEIDNIDNASYVGNIELDNFNIGNFLGIKDIGKVSLDLAIDGKGFTKKYLNTLVSGTVSKLYYNKYTYTNIKLEGNFKTPIFKGKVNVNDPNLFMDFDGLVDLSKKDLRYDFHTKIDYADLKKLNFMKDSISVFKGDIEMNISGNNIDNLAGTVKISQTAYQNEKDNYIFDDFTLGSTFDANRERTITINSPDIIEGRLVGKFKFDQLQKMIENAAGSLYANYEPNKVTKGQYLKFNFSIYNKIIEIFFPGIEVGKNTFVRGSINSDKDEFKLVFNSPGIIAFDNYFDKIKIDIDNKNPLYNAYIEMDTIRTKYYKFSEFSFINVTSRDTLFARTEFKGGKKAEDFYNLNFYHTIDKENNSVVGLKKSEMQFKDYLWFLNEDETDDNKVVFDKKFKNFAIENFVMTHENQKIELMGKLRDSTFKDLQLNFENVNLGKIIPDIDSLDVAGNLNGKIDFKQNNNVYKPTASVQVDSLHVNDIELGNLYVDIAGNDSFSKFTIDSSLENKNVESFLAEGSFVIENKQTVMDLDLRFDQFNLAALSPLGGTVISNIRGFVSGTSNISGSVKNPEVNGRLFLDKAGLRIPYLNVDYGFKESSIIDLAENQFIFQNATLEDTKHNTHGRINGVIKHKNFSKWNLDLTIDSDRLLALDTKDSEDAAYYGTAFIDGTAKLSGPTDALFIEVIAESKSGTEIKIPINNAESVGNKSFMHFLTPEEKYNLQKGIIGQVRDYKGLELKFELDVTPEAEIEVILDRETGHGMKARGNGTLLLEINTLGKFNMIGDYQVYEGSYNFRYRGLIDKRLDVKKFSTIVWEGDPMRARLNLEAVYKTTANPSVLLDNPSVNRKVPVEVGIGITGSLSSPEPDFSINFPTISSVLKSEIQTKLNDKDIRQTQALTLLSTGGFLSQDGVNQSAIATNLFETAGGIFDDIFQNPDDKVKVGLDIVSADRTPGNEADGSVGLTVSTQVNERITVNGKVGVPVGGINESAIVGNVEVQYRVNEDGSLNLRVFNRENDINYIGEGIGYTQGVGITYEVDFDTFKELVNKIFKNHQLDKVKIEEDLPPDSEIAPEYMNFPEKKKKTEPKNNAEAIPSKED